MQVPADSVFSLLLDVATARALVWVAKTGRDVDITDEAHLYFFDRYQRLADCYRQRGQQGRARQLEQKAAEHSLHGGWDGPPYAAAMALARPRRWVVTDAVSRRWSRGSDDAA